MARVLSFEDALEGFVINGDYEIRAPQTKNLACSRLHTTARASPSVGKYLSSVPFVNLDLSKTSCDPSLQHVG